MNSFIPKKKKKTKDFHEYNIICMSYINMSLLMEQIYLIFFQNEDRMYIADGKECYKQVTNEIAKLGINTPLACYKDINFADQYRPKQCRKSVHLGGCLC